MPKSLAMKEGADPSAIVKLPSYFFGKKGNLLDSFGKATKSKDGFTKTILTSNAGLPDEEEIYNQSLLGKKK